VLLPLAGRCHPPADEECNGVDDDLDGEIDEDVCPQRDRGSWCRYEAECGDGGTCLQNQCWRTCDVDTDCGDEGRCIEATYTDGDASGQGVCIRAQRGGGFNCEFYLCSGQYVPIDAAQGAVDCLLDVIDGPNFCADAGACIPQ